MMLMLVTFAAGGGITYTKKSKDPDCWHCIEQLFNCYKKTECHLKKNKHYGAHCRRGYNECMENCNKILERLKNDDFPSSYIYDKR